MRKFYLFMLMAVGLLIGTNVWANLPQRPTPPMESNAPEGVEMPEMTIPEHPAFPEKGLVKKTFNKVAKAAPRKAPMDGELFSVAIPGNDPFKTSSFSTALNLAKNYGNPIVLLQQVSGMGGNIIDAGITIDLNGFNLSLDGITIKEGFTLTLNNSQTGPNVVTINNGEDIDGGVEYSAYAGSIVKAENVTLSITGGEFTSTAATALSGYMNLTDNKLVNSYNSELGACKRLVANDVQSVCRIGADEYISLQIAFDMARLAGNQTTIEMIADATESEELYIYGGSDVILNLNGKTITFQLNSINIGLSPIDDNYVNDDDDKLTIVDNSQSGKIIGQGFPIYNYGTTTISDVTIESTDDGSTDYGYGVNNYALMTINSGRIVGKFAGAYNLGTMYINGGTLESTVEDSYYGYGILNYGTIEMTNGTIKGSGNYAVAIRNNAYTGYPSKITVTGGTIDGQSYYGAWSEGTLNIEGGTFNSSGTATLYAPKGTLNIKGNPSINNECEYNTTWYASCVYGAGGIVNIEGGTFEAKNFSIFGYGATINIKGGTLNAKGRATIRADYGTINISDEYKPTIINEGTEASTGTWTACCIYGQNTTTISIKGGTFMANNILLFAKCTFTIEGGTFYAAPYYTFYASGGNINLKGGKANTNEKKDFAMFAASGYALSKPVEGWYSVVKSDVSLNGVGYPSVADALVDAIEGDALYILDNISGDVDVTKSVHIYLNDKTITGCLSASNSANVLIHGTATSRVGSFNASAGATIKTDFGTYAFEPESKYLVDGCQAESAGEGLWKITAGEVVSLSINGGTPQNYTTLGAAVQAAGNEPSVITFLKDFSDAGNVAVGGTQTITIDMNGHKMSNATQPSTSFAMIENKGILTLKDSKDTNKNGTGGGEIGTASLGADMRFSPGYATNVILNCGKLTVESGLLTSYGEGSASYAIDNDAEDGPSHPGYGTTNKKVELYITGGKIVSLGTSAAIRMYLESTDDRDNIIDIQNAIVSSIWVQESNANAKGYLSVKNTIFTESLSASWHDVAKNLSVILDDVIIENSKFSTGIDYSNRVEGDSTLSCNNVRISSYRLSHPFPHLTNGQFQFKDDIYICFGKESTMKEMYPESQGYYYMPFDGCESYVEVYLSVQSYYRDFMTNIMPGYGLVCIDEENQWYEIRPLQGTTGEASEIYGELGNPWHQDKTWDLTEENVVPQDTTPVRIDHNVYVEEDTKADAASIIVEPDQTLTIKSGACLIVGDGGIVFNKETDEQKPGTIIVEPGATLLDGANGVVSEDTKNVVIQASDTEQGTFLFNPKVALNTQPFGTVELISHAGLRKDPNGNFVNYWHRFASPVVKLIEENFTNNWDSYRDATGLSIAAGTYFQTQIYQWNTSIRDWQRIDKMTNYCDLIVPFQGYTMLNNCTWEDPHNGGVTYTFKGNLVGNHNDDLTFLNKGYNYFGNSYTAPINIKALLETVDNGNINRTVYVWDAELQVFRGWSFDQLMYIEDETTPASIPSLHTFVMQLLEGNSAVSNIDYVNAIWNPVVNAVKDHKAPQRVQQLLDATLKINITAANGEKDAVVMMKDARYSNELDNGADAEKYMNEGSINIYAHANFANVSTLAQNEIEGTMLSISTNDETDYIMTFSCVTGEQYAIKDNRTGAIITISNGDMYAFSANANSTDENRFEIVSVRRTPTDTETIDANTEANSKVKGIYSVTGQYLGEAQDWFKMPAGVYVMDGQKVVK